MGCKEAPRGIEDRSIIRSQLKTDQAAVQAYEWKPAPKRVIRRMKAGYKSPYLGPRVK